jgi:DNA helicase HerA-like ATPase
MKTEGDNPCPERIIIFVDELNKYAPSSIDGSPILNSLIEITERGRSLGIVLFSAEQFRSAIHTRVKGNCATNVYGRTNGVEIATADFRYLPKSFSGMMTRLSKGQLIIQHPIFRSLLKISFPKPAYFQPEH